MKISKKNHRQIKMNRFYISKEIIIISMLLVFGINSHAQINKKINTKVSTRNIKYNNIKLENNIPLLIATSKDLLKNAKNKSSINKKLPNNTLTAIASVRSSSTSNITLSPKKLSTYKAGLEFTGSYFNNNLYIHPKVYKDRRLITGSKDFFSVHFDAKKGKTYRVTLKFDYTRDKSGMESCGNPKLIVKMGGYEQSFSIVEHANAIEFLIKSDITGKLVIYRLFNTMQCSSNSTSWHQPTFRFDEIKITEI